MQLDEISTRAKVEEELARLGDRLASGAGQGHRTVPHTADLRVEAWGPTREACLAETVRELVDSFSAVCGGSAAAHGRAALHRELG